MHIIYILYIICSFVVVMLPGDHIFQDITTPGWEKRGRDKNHFLLLLLPLTSRWHLVKISPCDTLGHLGTPKLTLWHLVQPSLWQKRLRGNFLVERFYVSMILSVFNNSIPPPHWINFISQKVQLILEDENKIINFYKLQKLFWNFLIKGGRANSHGGAWLQRGSSHNARLKANVN